MDTPGTKAWIAFVALILGIGAAQFATAASQKTDKGQEGKRPRLGLRAQPSVGIAPARILLTAELVGGTNDFEEYYCPTVTWDWGDDTVSESTTDCPPYESGKSEIQRRFTVEHTFKRSGMYKVYVRLKQRSREVAATSTTVQVQGGTREP